MGTSSTRCVTRCLLGKSLDRWIARSPSDRKRLQSCQPDPAASSYASALGCQAAQWKDGQETSAEGIQACGRRGYGFQAGRHPGPQPARVRVSGREGRALGGERCGLRAGDRTAFIREGGCVGRNTPVLSPRACGWCRNNTALGWDVVGSGYECGGVQPPRGGCYQPGTLRSDAAAIWKYRHSASSYSGSSASSSSAARMCRSHASCAAIPIAKRA